MSRRGVPTNGPATVREVSVRRCVKNEAGPTNDDGEERCTVPIDSRNTGLPPADAGQAMYELIREMYPLCRSITGDGLRHTLNILKGHIALDVHEVPSGTEVFDWTVPKEWNIRDAYVKNAQGRKNYRFQTLQPACGRLQHTHQEDDRIGRIARTPIYPA